jgi:hypothetical protein
MKGGGSQCSTADDRSRDFWVVTQRCTPHDLHLSQARPELKELSPGKAVLYHERLVQMRLLVCVASMTREARLITSKTHLRHTRLRQNGRKEQVSMTMRGGMIENIKSPRLTALHATYTPP